MNLLRKVLTDAKFGRTVENIAMGLGRTDNRSRSSHNARREVSQTDRKKALLHS